MRRSGIEQPLSVEGKHVAWCLFGVAASLIVVGGVSDTLPRHVVQVAPMVIAIDFALRRGPLGAWFAAPMFALWFVVMAAIWAYLFGLSDITSGTFSTLEVALTMVIAACAVFGLWKCVRAGRSAPLRGAVAMAVGGLVVQAAFLAFSLVFFA